ncbi:MAG: gliding motility-associated C-terminal domain-containing protein, partial [Bacteroidota bacterium]
NDEAYGLLRFPALSDVTTYGRAVTSFSFTTQGDGENAAYFGIKAYVAVDSDGDGALDCYDLDSDNDGCSDVIEAGFMDSDGDGYLGTSPVSVDSLGQVTGEGGYTTPADTDGNSIPDFRETNTFSLTLQNCPSNIILSDIDPNTCGATATWIEPTPGGNCGPVALVTNGYNSGDIFPPGTTMVEYTATDAGGNSTTCSFTVTVSDNVDPTASNPEPINVQCPADVPAPDALVVTDEADNCGTPNVTFVGDNQVGNVITRIYSITDDAGNSINAIQTITVQDTTDPTASDPAPINVQCFGDVPVPDIAAVIDEADNCSIPVVAFVGDNQVGNVITRTYSITDDAGNSINVTQNITVQDTTDPMASDPAPINVQCPGDVPVPDIAVVIDEADNCSVPVVAFVGDSQVGNTITRTYSVTDAAGNSIDISQDIIIQDTQAPVPEIATLPDIVAECSLTVNNVPLAMDNCDGTVMATTSDPLIYNTQGSYSITWSFIDSSGNLTIQNQNITINDTQAPVPNAASLPNLIIDCPFTLTDLPTATDNCLGTVQGITSDSLDFSMEGNYTITWTYDDGNGNPSQQTQDVVVQCPQDVDLEVAKTVMPQQVSLNDNVRFTITITNRTSQTATGIVIEEVLPTGYGYLTHSTSLGNYSLTLGEWNIPLLEGGGTATLELDVNVLDVDDYTNIASLAYLDQIDINPTNDAGMAEVLVLDELTDCLVFFNEITPNNDGANDTFYIECIEQYPDNLLQIFNRWGVKVFEMERYDNSWEGISKGRATLKSEERLPNGTYYYILDPRDGQTPVKTGWLYIIR